MNNGQTVSVSATIPGTTIVNLPDVPWTAGMNAQQALEAAYDLRQDPNYGFSLAYYGSTLGYLVEEIEHIGDQPAVCSHPNNAEAAPTPRQLRYLRLLAEAMRWTFRPPVKRADASEQMEELRAVLRSQAQTHDFEPVDAGYATAVREDELVGLARRAVRARALRRRSRSSAGGNFRARCATRPEGRSQRWHCSPRWRRVVPLLISVPS